MVNDGVTRDTSIINGAQVINFSSYNYLGMLELQFAVDGLLTGDRARRRARAAPSSHRIRHRLGHRGVAGHAQVVVAGEVDHLRAVDDRGVTGDAVVDHEVGVLDADCLAEGEPVGQRLDLLELADPELRGNCRRLRSIRRCDLVWLAARHADHVGDRCGRAESRRVDEARRGSCG